MPETVRIVYIEMSSVIVILPITKLPFFFSLDQHIIKYFPQFTAVPSYPKYCKRKKKLYEIFLIQMFMFTFIKFFKYFIKKNGS